jgi:hypothetical protein
MKLLCSRLAFALSVALLCFGALELSSWAAQDEPEGVRESVLSLQVSAKR